MSWVLFAKCPGLLPSSVLPNPSLSLLMLLSELPLSFVSLTFPSISAVVMKALVLHAASAWWLLLCCTGFLSPSSTCPPLWSFLHQGFPCFLPWGVSHPGCSLPASAAWYGALLQDASPIKVRVNWLLDRRKHPQKGQHCSVFENRPPFLWPVGLVILKLFEHGFFLSILQWWCGLPCRVLKQNDNELALWRKVFSQSLGAAIKF